MGSGEVAIVALSTMISLKVTFSDGLGGWNGWWSMDVGYWLADGRPVDVDLPQFLESVP